MADESYVASLKRELAGYQRQGRTDRAAAVRAELERLGETVETPKAPKAETAKKSPARRTRKPKA